MNLETLKIISNTKIAKDTFKLVLKRQSKIDIKPGQFAMLKVEGKYLKRPLSISDYDETSITFIYKILGDGTKILSTMLNSIELLYPLGNGFNLSSNKATIIAGGIGIAPMHNLAKELNKLGVEIDFHLGYKTKDELYLIDELSSLGTLNIYTEDGSIGNKGYCIPNSINSDSYIYGCGPTPMLNSIAKTFDNDGELSTEEYMACGFGICSGCAIKLKSGMKKVCSDGPVFDIKEFDVN